MPKLDTSKYNDDVARKAQKQVKLSQEYCEPYFDRFLDNYKHYYQRIIDEAVEADPDSYPFYSQMTIPVSYQIVETILPRMFSRLPSFTITTDDMNDEKDENAIKELIKYQMNHPFLIDDPIFLRLATAAKELFIAGNAWGEVPWYKKEIEVTEWQPYSPTMGLTEPSWDNLEKIKAFQSENDPALKPEWKLVKVKKTMIDAPVFTHRNLFHVFPDPKKKFVSQLGWIWNEEMMTLDEIMDMVKSSGEENYQNLDELKRMQAFKEKGSKTTNYDDELAGIFGSSDYSTKDETENQYKVWIGRTPEKLKIVVNEKLTIRNAENPNGDGKIGMFLMKDIPNPHELFAWGEPDPIKKIEDGMTDQANMRNDNVFYDLMRMWKLNPEALVDGEEFIPEPGNVIQMNDLAGLEPIETGATKATAYKEYSEWEQIIQNVSGVSDYATGSADPNMNQTKGGVEMLQQAANARFAFKLQLFENLGLKAMGTMYVQRNMRFFDTPQNVTVDGKKTTVQPDQIRRLRGNVMFSVDSGSTEAVSQNTELTKWKTVTDLVGANKPPFHNLTPESMDEIAKSLLFALRINNVDKIIKRIPPQPPAQPGAPGSALSGGMPPPQVMEQENVLNAPPTEPVAPTVPEDNPAAPAA